MLYKLLFFFLVINSIIAFSQPLSNGLLTKRSTFNLSCNYDGFKEKYKIEHESSIYISAYLQVNQAGRITNIYSYPLKGMRSFYPKEDSIWFLLPDCFEKAVVTYNVAPLFWEKNKGKKKVIKQLNTNPNTRPNGGEQELFILLKFDFMEANMVWYGVIILWENLTKC